MFSAILCIVLLFTSEEVLLARLVEAEARGEPFYGQYLVASVVMNRVADEGFRSTIRGVIQQPGQFAKPHPTYSASALAAAKLAMAQPREGILYFFNKKTATNTTFVNQLDDCFEIGNHTFCKTIKHE